VCGEEDIDPREAKALTCESKDLITWASSDHHHHAFHHLHIPGTSPKGANKFGIKKQMSDIPDLELPANSVDPVTVTPHLSRQVSIDARRCFHTHARLIHLEVNPGS